MAATFSVPSGNEPRKLINKPQENILMNLDMKMFGGPLNPPKGEVEPVVWFELIEHLELLPAVRRLLNLLNKTILYTTSLSGYIAEKIMTRSKDLRQHI